MNSSIHLLFVTHLYYPAVGGVEVHIKNLAEGLVRRGYRVTVLTSNAYSTEGFFLGDKRRIETMQEIINGVSVMRLGFRTFGRRLLKRLRRTACRFKYPFNHWVRMFSYGPRNPHFISAIVGINPDIIYAAPLPTLNVYYAYRAAEVLKKPLFIIPSYHIFDPCGFYNPIYFKMMREADLVMAQSSIEKDYLAREGFIAPEKIVILPPMPLKEDQLRPRAADVQALRTEYHISQKHVVLYVGQHGFHKNVHRVLDSMPYVWQVCPDTALVIAGGVSDNTRDIKLRAAACDDSQNPRIYFIDNFPIERKDAVFQLGDLFISLSEFESFGIVFVEAMINGLPIIASKNSVARSIVSDFQTGVLVEPASPTEVAGAIIELLTDHSLRKTYSQNALDSALAAYHPEFILNKWEEYIHDHVPGNGSTRLSFM